MRSGSMYAVGGRSKATGWCGAVLLLLGNSCALMPGELNLSPFYRHRLDEEGNVLEMDVLWPIIHYELTPQGGDDFRIRPLYRYVSGESPRGNPASWAQVQASFEVPVTRAAGGHNPELP